MEYFRATLRVSGPAVDPRTISSMVEIEPTQSHSAGDLAALSSPSGPIRREHGYWSISIEDDDPQHFSNRLLELIRRVPPGVLRDDPISDVLVDVFVGIFGIRDQSTLTIDADVHRELGLRGWPLVFDMYVEDTDRGDEPQ